MEDVNEGSKKKTDTSTSSNAGDVKKGRSKSGKTATKKQKKKKANSKEKINYLADMSARVKDNEIWKKYNSTAKRDAKSREYLLQNLPTRSVRIRPGDLMMFDYVPIHKEELEYYDLKPVVIFFSVRKGYVVGFNIHYYPPLIRISIISGIIKMYKEFYCMRPKKRMAIDYYKIVRRLKRDGISIGIRMYKVDVIRNIRRVTFKNWGYAMLTEGKFMKKTRKYILNYWKSHRLARRK